MSEYFHECGWCNKRSPCSKQEWSATEGYGDPWFCCDECEMAWGSGGDLLPTPDTINEDDWRDDR